MSASIRIKIIGGTHIDTAYYDCAHVSALLGGISVETNFNGVEMFFHNQPIQDWEEEYHNRLYGPAKKDGDAAQ